MVAPWSAPDAQARSAPPAEPHGAPAPTRRVPAAAPLVTHPLTRFDVVDRALDAIKAAPATILGAAAAFLVPVELLSTWLRRDQLDAADVSSTTDDRWFLAVGLRLLALAFVTVAVAHVLWRWQRGSAPTAREAIGVAVRRAPAILVAFVVGHLLEGLAVALLLLPALFVVPLLFVAIPVLAVEEGVGGLGALRRSWRLGAGDVGLAMGGYVTVAAVALALTVALSGVVYLSDALFDFFAVGGAWVVQVAVGIAVWAVVVPFVAAAATLHYFDLRVRREGLDIALGVERHFDAAR